MVQKKAEWQDLNEAIYKLNNSIEKATDHSQFLQNLENKFKEFKEKTEIDFENQ